MHPIIIGLAGIPYGFRTSRTTALVAFVPKLPDIRKLLHRKQSEALSALKKLVLVECISKILKCINMTFRKGMEIHWNDGTSKILHPFALTCITDGPGGCFVGCDMNNLYFFP